jgi:hypothetical protein
MYLVPIQKTGRVPRRRISLGLRGLGDASHCVYYSADGSAPESLDYESNASECAANGGTWFPATSNIAPPPVSTRNFLPSSTTTDTWGSFFGQGRLGYIGLGLGIIGVVAILRGRR